MNSLCNHKLQTPDNLTWTWWMGLTMNLTLALWRRQAGRDGRTGLDTYSYVKMCSGRLWYVSSHLVEYLRNDYLLDEDEDYPVALPAAPGYGCSEIKDWCVRRGKMNLLSLSAFCCKTLHNNITRRAWFVLFRNLSSASSACKPFSLIAWLPGHSEGPRRSAALRLDLVGKTVIRRYWRTIEERSIPN